ncbi:MAG: MopE-related protein, partial [Polyangiaceae bacterium]
MSGCGDGTQGTGGAGGTGGDTTSTTGGGGGTGGNTGGGGTGGAGGMCTPGETKSCYSGPDGTEGVGLCKAGTQTCKANGDGFGPCTGEVLPADEVCATAGDDDCDGQTNEDGADCSCIPGSTKACYSGPPETEGVGPCKGGTQVCNDDGQGYGACEGEIAPLPETCETPEDDDCDGKVNEDGESCVCPAGEMVPCYTGPAGTENVGDCKGGMALCADDGKSLGACLGQVIPAAETCLAAGDEDCDGQSNEEGPGCSCVPGTQVACYTGPAGTQGIGQCKGGLQDCGAQGMPVGPCVGEITPAVETCNTAVDDDCDGLVNEDGAGCSCIPGSTKACYSGPAGTEGVGVCAAGMQTCAADGLSYGPCMGEVLPSAENCNTPANEDCTTIVDCGSQYWAKSFGAPGDQQGYAVTRDAQDNVLITGRFTGQ